MIQYDIAEEWRRRLSRRRFSFVLVDGSKLEVLNLAVTKIRFDAMSAWCSVRILYRAAKWNNEGQ